jgi:hypothetical protein
MLPLFLTLSLLHGVATYYDNGPGLYAAAGPALRHALGTGWRGSVIKVCANERSQCVKVRLTDFCKCGPRHGKQTLLDLSPAAFRALAPLSRGVLEVTVRGTGKARPRATSHQSHGGLVTSTAVVQGPVLSLDRDQAFQAWCETQYTRHKPCLLLLNPRSSTTTPAGAPSSSTLTTGAGVAPIPSMDMARR